MQISRKQYKGEKYLIIRFEKYSEYVILIFYDKINKSFCASLFYGMSIIHNIKKENNEYCFYGKNQTKAYCKSFKNAVKFSISIYNLKD